MTPNKSMHVCAILGLVKKLKKALICNDFFLDTAAVHIFDSFHPFHGLGTGVQASKSATLDLCLVANLNLSVRYNWLVGQWFNFTTPFLDSFKVHFWRMHHIVDIKSDIIAVNNVEQHVNNLAPIHCKLLRFISKITICKILTVAT